MHIGMSPGPLATQAHEAVGGRCVFPTRAACPSLLAFLWWSAPGAESLCFGVDVCLCGSTHRHQDVPPLLSHGIAAVRALTVLALRNYVAESPAQFCQHVVGFARFLKRVSTIVHVTMGALYADGVRAFLASI